MPAPTETQLPGIYGLFIRTPEGHVAARPNANPRLGWRVEQRRRGELTIPVRNTSRDHAYQLAAELTDLTEVAA